MSAYIKGLIRSRNSPNKKKGYSFQELQQDDADEMFSLNPEERPGSDLSQDSGNCDNTFHSSGSGSDEESQGDDAETSSRQIRTCAERICQISDKLHQKKKEQHQIQHKQQKTLVTCENLNINNNESNCNHQSDVLSTKCQGQKNQLSTQSVCAVHAQIVTNHVEALKTELSNIFDSDTLSAVDQQVHTLMTELSAISKSINARKTELKNTLHQKSASPAPSTLRQTYVVSSGSNEQVELLSNNKPPVIQPTWSQFPPSKAKRAPRNVVVRETLQNIC